MSAPAFRVLAFRREESKVVDSSESLVALLQVGWNLEVYAGEVAIAFCHRSGEMVVMQGLAGTVQVRLSDPEFVAAHWRLVIDENMQRLRAERGRS